ATVKTMQFLVDLVKNGYSPSPETQQAFGGGAAMFYTGKVAMTTSGHWWLPSIYTQIKKGADLDVGIAPIPHNPGGKNATVIYESGWAVPKASKHRKLAVELAAWLSSPFAQKIRTGAYGLAISSIKSIAEEEAKEVPMEQAFLSIVKDGRPTLGSETKFYRPLIEDTMDEAIQKVLIKGETVQQALDWAAQTIDKTIEERL
ncbi:MAG: extracellular solute-binding protein, partial [Nitrospiraceae bacterium]|nr:extracellular solute-binding protein [Nitrospiraceae bacterium]